MFRGSLQQTAQFAPREEIVNADLARDDGGGLSAPPYLFSACEAFWRISDQMTAKAGGDGGGELSCDADAEFEWLAELLRERRRICEAVASTPANSIEALTTKKEVVCEIAREEGASEMANSLIASLFADFDRLMGDLSVGRVKRLGERAKGLEACLAANGSGDTHLLSACIEFWRVWENAERVWEEVELVEVNGVEVTREADGRAIRCLGVLEARIALLADKEARSVNGIVAKTDVFEICLLFQGGIEVGGRLAASLFEDFDRVIATYHANAGRSFPNGGGKRGATVEKYFLAGARR